MALPVQSSLIVKWQGQSCGFSSCAVLLDRTIARSVWLFFLCNTPRSYNGCDSGSTSCGKLQKRFVATEATVAACRSVAGTFCGYGSISCSVWKRCRSQERSVASEVSVAASKSVAGAFCGYGSINCSVQERCRSVLWPRKQQLQRPGVL